MPNNFRGTHIFQTSSFPQTGLHPKTTFSPCHDRKTISGALADGMPFDSELPDGAAFRSILPIAKKKCGAIRYTAQSPLRENHGSPAPCEQKKSSVTNLPHRLAYNLRGKKGRLPPQSL
jgi:hypothetical protein